MLYFYKRQGGKAVYEKETTYISSCSRFLSRRTLFMRK